MEDNQQAQEELDLVVAQEELYLQVIILLLLEKLLIIYLICQVQKELAQILEEMEELLEII